MTNNKSETPKNGQRKLLQVGEFAKTIGKTVRALHLYEELGLLRPVERSKGGFRLYDEASIERARWIVKLQGIGFTLAQIQVFVSDFENAASGRSATTKARAIFQEKLTDLQTQIAKLQASESDLLDALAYLDRCTTCPEHLTPADCAVCTQNNHEGKDVPQLFAGLSEAATPQPAHYVDAERLNRAKSAPGSASGVVIRDEG
jgi:DNA-binding transcriptional MerR regulator